MKSWSVFGSLLALSIACGVSCSDNGSDGSATAINAGAGGSGPLGAGGSAAANTGAGGDGPDYCSTLNPADCTADPACASRTARLVYPDCTQAKQFIECTQPMGCGQLATRARDPQGREWLFDDTCLPEGWQPLPWTAACGSGDGGTGGGGPALGCSSLGVATCLNALGCVVIKARRVSSPPTSPDEAVGCQDSSHLCSEVNITARDPQGQEWAFPDTCIPAGWTGEGGAGN